MMPGSTLSYLGEPDEFRAALRFDGHAELLVPDRSRFRARLVRIDLPHVSLICIEECLPRIAFIRPATLVIVLPLDRKPRQVWAGTAQDSRQILTVNAREAVHWRTTGPCSSAMICCQPDYLIQHGRVLAGPEFSIPPGLHRWHPAPAALEKLTRLFSAASYVTRSRPDLAAAAETARGLEQELIAALVSCLSRPPTAPDRTEQRRTQAMARLERILAAHPDRLPVRGDLAALLGVSSRTLFAWCHQHLGMSCSRYLRLRQLHQVFHALRGANSRSSSVADIARRHGVTELGRFSGTYRDAFGELPSSTLRRAPHLPKEPWSSRDGVVTGSRCNRDALDTNQ